MWLLDSVRNKKKDVKIGVTVYVINTKYSVIFIFYIYIRVMRINNNI